MVYKSYGLCKKRKNREAGTVKQKKKRSILNIPKIFPISLFKIFQNELGLIGTEIEETVTGSTILG